MLRDPIFPSMSKEAIDPADPFADLRPDVTHLVTEDDTPVDNLASEKHQRLLTEALYTSWHGPPPEEEGGPRPFIAAANVGLFARPTEPLVPDVFLSVDVSVHPDFWKKEHRTYLFWEFGKPPDVVIEVVSNREGGELDRKKRGYARMRVAHYVVWDPQGLLGEERLQTFELRGELYVPVAEPWFEALGLGLRVWTGPYEGVEAKWLRWCDRDGNVVPTGAERADSAERRADAAEQRANAAEQQAEQLAEKLRAMGIDPSGD